MECASRQRGKGKRNGKQQSGMVSKTFVGKRFARNGVIPAPSAGGRGMERQCAERIVKNSLSLELGFKADLISKL
tara:strand:+ start:772 stop:996 length:225 start_codon:yes stop_codon:yes gene_type:complete